MQPSAKEDTLPSPKDWQAIIAAFFEACRSQHWMAFSADEDNIGHCSSVLCMESVHHEERRQRLYPPLQRVSSPIIAPRIEPLVIVKKKDGNIHLCVDYRRLNSITLFDLYPMPRADELIDHLGKARYITTLDLAKNYWQVLM